MCDPQRKLHVIYQDIDTCYMACLIRVKGLCMLCIAELEKTNVFGSC